jgi:hypothetical protein
MTASSAVATRQQWVTILRYTHPTSGGKNGKTDQLTRLIVFISRLPLREFLF